MLLKEFEKTANKYGCERIVLTIDPENIPSQKLFEKHGYQNISHCEGEVIEVLGCTAVKDYYKPGRHFMLYEKKLKLIIAEMHKKLEGFTELYNEYYRIGQLSNRESILFFQLQTAITALYAINF